MLPCAMSPAKKWLARVEAKLTPQAAFLVWSAGPNQHPTALRFLDEPRQALALVMRRSWPTSDP